MPTGIPVKFMSGLPVFEQCWAQSPKQLHCDDARSVPRLSGRGGDDGLDGPLPARDYAPGLSLDEQRIGDRPMCGLPRRLL